MSDSGPEPLDTPDATAAFPAGHGPSVDPALTGPDGWIDADVACLGCGYNLRGQVPGGMCPECGLPIADSLSGNRLSLADPAWVAGLRAGATALLWQVLAVIVGVVAIMAVAFATGGLRGRFDTMIAAGAVVGVVVVAISVYAYVKVTAPEPDPVGEDPAIRRVARAVLLAGIAVGALQVALLLAGVPDAVGLALSGVGGVLNVVGTYALLAYLALLAARVPDPGLVTQTTVVKWGLTAVFAVQAVAEFVAGAVALGSTAPPAPGRGPLPGGGASPAADVSPVVGCLVGLGFLIFGGWYIVLLFLHRARFAAAAGRGMPGAASYRA